jgi:PilZ domain
MLGLFGRESPAIQLMKRMDRIINSTYQSQISTDSNESDRRNEFRAHRNLSCMVLEVNHSDDIADCWPCLTLDLSSRGSLIFTTKEIPGKENYIFILRHASDFVCVRSKCIRCSYNNFGGYQVGFHFTELVDLKTFPTVKLFLEMLSRQTDQQ